MLYGIAAKGQVVAGFEADITQGCVGFKVQFTDLGNLRPGDPANKWFWDFGNGNTSPQQNPGTIYFTPGKYTVKLVVSNASGKDSVIKKDYIIVYNSPAVNFATDNTSGCVPFTVQFSDQSTAGSGIISKWEWDFGDGTTSTQRSPSHTYTVTGNFTITFKVTNSLGCVEVKTSTSFIHVNELPKADFTSGSSAASCKPPVLVNFFNKSTSGAATITAIKWNFGDGGTSSAANPSHTYTSSGTYPVTLIVTNQNGCVDTITKPTVIGSVTPAFTGPDIVCQGAPAHFVNTSSPAIASALWNFGDNTSSSDIDPVKSFATAGTFTVKLVNNFGACSDSVAKRITVLPKLIADFSFPSPAPGCTLPVSVSFTGNTIAASSYFWDFGDGATSTLINPSHTYTTFGVFAVKLVVSSANGCLDTLIKSDAVSIVPVKINKLFDVPFNGCVPRSQNFSAGITSPEPVTSYFWNFGDGTTSTAATPSHVYNVEGKYDVSLKITTVNGCTDTFSLPAAIAIINKPVAKFEAAPLIACAFENIHFTDLSTGSIQIYKWDFGDGGTSDSSNPLHHYADTGFFTVKLIVGSLACFDTVIVKKYVYINPPIAKFSVKFDCQQPLDRSFINNSVVAQTSTWTFGDGSSSTDVNPVHTYALPGVYFVHLHVTNNDCFDDVTDTIQVIDEHPDFTINQNVTCRNNTSVFTAINIKTENITYYTWNFGNNTPPVTTSNPVISYNYLTPGLFSPALIIRDNLGCAKTVTHPASISIYGPIANFSNPEGACFNTPVAITDRSQPTASYPITSWIFNYGDGTTDSSSTQPAFSHTYSTPKTYDLSLIVTDSYGCKDTLFMPDAINITRPKAAFLLSDSISCNNSNINFINQSTGLNLTYAWALGDGTTATSANLSHSFSNYGNYSIRLAVKDRYGCTDTITKLNGIVIGNAKAAFTLSDSTISCPPAQINFINHSSYFTSVKWDFDDGNFSNIVNPSHYFLAARTYHIKQIAFGHGSCSDTTVKDVVVKGPSGSLTYSPVLKCAPAAIQFTASASNSNNNFTWDFGDGTTTLTFNSAISHVYTTPGRYLPKLLLRDSSLNCQVSVFGADTISISGALAHIKTLTGLFCDSAGIQFFDSSFVQFDAINAYLWTFGDGSTSATRSPFHNYVTPGIYPVNLIVKTVGGCTDSSEKSFVKIVKSPKVTITGPSETCINQPVTFSGTLEQDTSSVKWRWDFNNGTSFNNSAPPPQTYTAAQNNTVKATVTNSSGCINTAIKILTVHPLPAVDAGPDSVICRGQSIMLQATGADTFLWRNASSLSCTTCANPIASPVDTSVFYLVTGTSAVTTCKKTDSVQVKVVQPFKILSATADTLCAGQSIQLWVRGTDNYNWSPAIGLNNPGSANPIAKPDKTTLYTVTGHDAHGCFTDVAQVLVTVYPIPVFNIVDDNITISSGNSATLKTTSSADVLKWQWFPSSGLSCSDCAQPVATPNNDIVYKAIATNGGGCRTEDRVTVKVFCNNGNLYVPNTFSPNNDGSNDVFFPRGKGITGVKNLRVFNRWGTVVFEKSNFSINDAGSGWNGTFNGKPLDADTFVYQLEVICNTGQILSFKGDVTLIR